MEGDKVVRENDLKRRKIPTEDTFLQPNYKRMCSESIGMGAPEVLFNLKLLTVKYMDK